MNVMRNGWMRLWKMRGRRKKMEVEQKGKVVKGKGGRKKRSREDFGCRHCGSSRRGSSVSGGERRRGEGVTEGGDGEVLGWSY